MILYALITGEYAPILIFFGLIFGLIIVRELLMSAINYFLDHEDNE